MSGRPAGLSSDEYSEDEFDYLTGEFHNYSKQNVVKPELTEEEKHEKLLHTLFLSLHHGHDEESLQIIDEHQLPIDVELKDKWTPLLIAASNGHASLAQTFIERGADVNQVKDTSTVMMHACNISHFNPRFCSVLPIVKCLIEHHADPNCVNKLRMTAFLCAASNGNLEVIKYLIDYCDKDAVDNQGWNALFFAVNENHVELVKFLLEAGLNCKKSDVRRNTLLDYAQMYGYSKIAKLLPDKERQYKAYETYLCESYDYTKEIANPKFMRDVKVMLVGMNCGPIMQNITIPSMDLYTFLTLTEDDLRLLGITRPYQLNRILGGLYRFHRQPYKFKSLPHIEKDKVLTTYDVGFTLISALRHYVTMRASLKYLAINANEWQDDALVQLALVRQRITTAKKLANDLRRRCLKWERANAKVDLVKYPSEKRRNRIFYVMPIVTAITIVLYFRYHI